MPRAVSGGEEAGKYVFTISATIEEIKSYYSKELTKMGKMCVLNAFTSGPTSDGLMCLAGGPMVIVMIDTLEDGSQQVTIIVE